MVNISKRENVRDVRDEKKKKILAQAENVSHDKKCYEYTTIAICLISYFRFCCSRIILNAKSANFFMAA